MLRTYLYLLIIIIALIGGFFSINYPVESAPINDTPTNNRNSKEFDFPTERNFNAVVDDGDYWLPMAPLDNMPTSIHFWGQIWTGEEMLVFGWIGNSQVTDNKGYKYNPRTDSWTEISYIGAPSLRRYFQAVWTGTEMIVWGGEAGNSGPTLNSGGRYNPETDTWLPMSTVNAPSGRYLHSMVWTGEEMIVWGGDTVSPLVIPTNTGGRYDPETDTWKSMTTENAPIARTVHAATWTGSKMFVFGGAPDYQCLSCYVNTGGLYDPVTDSWVATSTNGTPEGLLEPRHIMTSEGLFFWGNKNLSSEIVGTGAIYNPQLDSWTPITTTNAPLPRNLAPRVWTGNEVIIVGGVDALGDKFNTGFSYNPETDIWTPIANMPDARSNFKAFWTGQEMIIWSGQDQDGIGLNTGARYYPSTSAANVYDVTLSSDDALIGGASTAITYTLQMTNTGNAIDTYDITSTGSDWVTTIPENNVTLNPQETTDIYVVVTIPINASDNEQDIATINVTSRGDGNATDSVLLTTICSLDIVIANFIADPISGVAPLAVQFEDNSIGNITTWAWDFGDGTTVENQQTPIHTYTAPGEYTVSLTVSNSEYADIEEKTSYVFVSENPTDSFEPDNNCIQASTIPTNGLVQEHTFHQQADEDWVVFQATAGTQYHIDAQIPPNSPADVTLELFSQCAGLPLETQNHAYAPGVRLQFESPLNGSIYMRWINSDSNLFGQSVAYHLSVREFEQEATPGALIIVAGKLKSNDILQPNIHSAANRVYELFQGQGYDANRVYYLATDLSLPGVDALATTANLQAALTTWASDKVGADQPLTLYLVDHGDADKIYLDKPAGQWVTPTQLDSWLSQLEVANPGLKINIIVEACQSGSFMTLPQTISKPGRVVIASTGSTNLAYASPQGAVFSDHFTTALGQGQSLYQSFQTARWATQVAFPYQTPWLDDNGNNIANETNEGVEAAQRGFAFAGTLADEVWVPYIVQAEEPPEIENGQGVLRAQVRDNERVKRVWAVVYPPSYQSPTDNEELIHEVLPTIVLQNQGGEWYAATYVGFNEMGIYRVVIYAEDDDGLEARPKDLEVHTGWVVYLPAIVK